jgi:lipopolysaccharide biosynthesis glycosyltransferase
MRTLIYTTAVNTEDRAINDIDIFNITKISWEHYCKRHNIDFYVIDEPQYETTPPHWFRYWIFDLKPNYDRYMYIDTDIMAKWDAPNIFEYCDEKNIYAVKDNSGLSWIWEGINGYQTMFPDTKLDWDNYFNSGVLVFSKKHRYLIEDFKQFYIDNKLVIEDYRAKLRKGFDQTIFNYFLTWYDFKVNLISEKWNLFHMIRREILYNGYFIDMGYFWHFNGLDRNIQVQQMQQIWNNIENKYSLEEVI